MNASDNRIRFLLDGNVHEPGDVAPTTTVLQYVREHLRRCGTKEGCAEGDCGACTVVLGELADGRVRYRAVNACIQFVPTLDGKALFTVESLKVLNQGELHPVQQAMVECHGSQCGFCTPGFVMSLYALYCSTRGSTQGATHGSTARPDEEAVRHVLSGNLCRCTGYRPILAAAQRMYEIEPRAAQRDADLVQQLEAIRVTCTKQLTHGSATYIAPATLDELARTLARNPEATVLAGGTDVGLWVTKKYSELPAVVYVGNVAELKRVTRLDGFIDIGAGVSLTDAFAHLLAEYPDLAEIARRFASPPICNAGTLGGNVANGSPIGDSMPALICLGARVLLRSAGGERELPLEDFYLDYMKKDLRPGEFVAAVRVPRARAGQHLRSYKISKRFDQDISAVCAAFTLQIEDGRVRHARVAFGGMAATPKRAAACEQALTGSEWNTATIAKAIQALARDFRPLTDMRASSDYRQQVAGNLLRRLHADLAGTAAATRVWDHAS